MTGVPLTSYTLRITELHVRAMPASTPGGEPFSGPGVDLRGPDAARAIEAARPVTAWLDAREPGVKVRSISIRTAGPRVLVSLEPIGSDPRPRTVRLGPPYADELREAARGVEHVIGEACARVLARRRT